MPGCCGGRGPWRASRGGAVVGLFDIGIGARGRISGGFMRGRSFGVGVDPAALLLFSFFLIMFVLLLNFYFTFI
jgi:hypothetical protein